VEQGGTLRNQFAGTVDTAGVGRLLELGVAVDALYEGDPYFGIAADSAALNVAAWRAWHEAVRLLIERGGQHARWAGTYAARGARVDRGCAVSIRLRGGR
jgi:hypothetical protein